MNEWINLHAGYGLLSLRRSNTKWRWLFKYENKYWLAGLPHYMRHKVRTQPHTGTPPTHTKQTQQPRKPIHSFHFGFSYYIFINCVSNFTHTHAQTHTHRFQSNQTYLLFDCSIQCVYERMDIYCNYSRCVCFFFVLNIYIFAIRSPKIKKKKKQTIVVPNGVLQHKQIRIYFENLRHNLKYEAN